MLDVELATLEILEGAPVAGFATGQAGEHALHGRAAVDQRIELLVDPLVHRHFARQHDHGRARVFAHGVGQDVGLDFRLAELDGQQRHRLVHRAACGLAVHDFDLERVPVVAPLPRHLAALAGQDAVLLGPLADAHGDARRDGSRGRRRDDLRGAGVPRDRSVRTHHAFRVSIPLMGDLDGARFRGR